ncbi:hypothetical protein M0804_012219 [Polistes exclamans]|nr:hypothetical protein M0804_012219 [Polistes exclamans]
MTSLRKGNVTHADSSSSELALLQRGTSISSSSSSSSSVVVVVVVVVEVVVVVVVVVVVPVPVALSVREFIQNVETGLVILYCLLFSSDQTFPQSVSYPLNFLDIKAFNRSQPVYLPVPEMRLIDAQCNCPNIHLYPEIESP